jgi:hypothetical protein
MSKRRGAVVGGHDEASRTCRDVAPRELRRFISAWTAIDRASVRSIHDIVIDHADGQSFLIREGRAAQLKLGLRDGTHGMFAVALRHGGF